MNLLLAYEAYLVAVLALRGALHWRAALLSARLVQQSRRWPNLLAATRSHKHLLFTLPNLAWAALFLGLLGTYAAFLHVVYPEAHVSPQDLARRPVLLAAAAGLAAAMLAFDVASFWRPPSRNFERTARRLDRAERVLAWGGPVGRLFALPRLRRRLLRASLSINSWLQRSFLRLALRGGVALALWAPLALPGA